MNIELSVNHVRAHAGLFDLRERRGCCFVSGSDRTTFLQALTSNDVNALSPNEGQTTCLLDKKSHVLADFRVYLDADQLWISSSLDRIPVIVAELERLHFSEDITIHADGDIGSCVAVQGPDAHRILTELIGSSGVPARGEMRRLSYAEGPLIVSEMSYTGDPSYEMWVGERQWDGLIEGLMAAGKAFDLLEFSFDVLEVLRVESGIPLYGVDFDETVMLMEIDRQDEMISFTKGCYPGQEIVARVKSRGSARRLLRGLVFDEPRTLTCGDRFRFRDKDGGEIRSSCWSPTLGKTLAMAYLNKHMHMEEGEVEIMLGDESVVATVSRLPFYFPAHLDDKARKAYMAGMKAFHSDDYESARGEFEIAITWNPHMIDAYEALAVTLERLTCYDEAIVHNRRFSELAPNAVMARANLSRIYMLKGMIKEAETEQAKATAISMRLAAREAQQDHDEGALVGQEAEDRSRRMAIFRQVLDLDPADEIANFGLGKLLQELGQNEESVTCLMTVVEQNDQYSAAYALLADSLLRLGRVDDARSTLTRGIQVAGDQGDLMPMRAMEQLLKET